MTPLPTLGTDGFINPANAPMALSQVLSTFFWLIMIIGGLTMFVLIILGGFGILTSGGEQQRLQDGRNKITWAIIGFIILLSTFAVVTLIEQVFNLCLGVWCEIDLDALP